MTTMMKASVRFEAADEAGGAEVYATWLMNVAYCLLRLRGRGLVDSPRITDVQFNKQFRPTTKPWAESPKTVHRTAIFGLVSNSRRWHPGQFTARLRLINRRVRYKEIPAKASTVCK